MVYFYNAFGITPTKNYEAAGYDWYIPNIDDNDKDKIENLVKPAIKQSYNINEDQLQQLIAYLKTNVSDRFYLDIDDDPETLVYNKEARYCFEHNIYNVVLLYLSYVAKSKNWLDAFNNPLVYPVMSFVHNNLLFDLEKNVPGIKMSKDNTLLINSGVKEILPPQHAGVFFNKSGRGSSGYDIRACVVDEDYTGYVHLNVAFTGQDSANSVVYCGDKLVQQLILPLYKSENKSICKKEFEELTSKSKRGEAGFGSSNEKH